MYTQCPHCEAIFQLSTAQLKAANGEVRCGQCLTVFNALNHLSDEIPSSPEPAKQDPANNTDPWAEEHLVEPKTKDTASQWAVDTVKPETANNGDNLLETSPKSTPDTTTETTEADIFSKVIAEANQSTPATEAIDQFEEFLDSDTPLPIDSEVELQAATEETTDGLDTFTHLSDETPEAVLEKVLEEAIEKESTDEEPIIAAFDDTAPDSDDFDTVNLGEVEEVTADLDTEMNIDITEEFSEFDKYVSEAEAATGEVISESDSALPEHALNDVSSDEPSADTFVAKDVAKDAAKGAEKDTDLDTENEAIIIEEADLEPITSSVYADIIEARTESKLDNAPTSVETDDTAHKITDKTAEASSPVDDFSDIEAAAAEVSTNTAPNAKPEADEPQPANSAEVLNIPALIMEDLHAAKAEQLRPSNAPWVVGCLVLMLSLVLQVVYHSRDDLAKDASLRPWLIQMCQLANCTLSQPYDIKQIDIIGREVRTHPSAKKALIASTTLINNANFIQPFPLLTVVFSNINGKPLAQRRFTPREYLSSNVDLSAGMTPDMPVRIELELIDPGKAAVNYEFHAEVDPRNTRPLT